MCQRSNRCHSEAECGVEDGDDADQNALSRMGLFISEQVDLWWKMAEVALCFWLHQPSRTLGRFPALSREFLN